jgi:hypothetical protein
MRTNLKSFVCLCLALACAGGTVCTGTNQSGRGKFYIVGMGTVSDLIAVRGAEVIGRGSFLDTASER